MSQVVSQSENELIPLLIEYVKQLGVTFPIEKVNHLNNEILIDRIKECIKKKKIYEVQIFKLDNVQNLSDNDFQKIIPLIKKSMDSINYNYGDNIVEILDIITLRNKGKSFTFSDHLKALIISMLSNHRWGDSNIRDNIFQIDTIFHDYEKNYLKKANPNDIIIELKKIHCTNPMIKKQVESLSYNISVLEKIERDYQSLDNYILTHTPNDIANCFNDGKYKLKQIGKSFTFDYLKRVGISTCKPTPQLKRLFGSNRLSVVNNQIATNGQVLSIVGKLSKINNISELEIESLLQQFCLSSSANICGEEPKCQKCKLRDICSYDNMKFLQK